MVDRGGGGGGDGRTSLISRHRASLGEIELARFGSGSASSMCSIACFINCIQAFICTILSIFIGDYEELFE